VRAFHRVAGAVVATQLLIWIVTGLLFNVKYRYDEAYEQLTPIPSATDGAGSWVSPADALQRSGIEASPLRNIHLLHDNRGYLYLFDVGPDASPALYLADAQTGQLVSALDAEGAEAVLRSAVQRSPHAASYGAVKSAIKTTKPSALVGRETDAWELTLETGQQVVITAYTAEISHDALLNTGIDWTYRIHYLQYTPWKPVNIALVLIFSIMTLSLVASGVSMLVEKRRRHGYGARKLRF
jgi:uncharacterized iron-regulated membrane protein